MEAVMSSLARSGLQGFVGFSTSRNIRMNKRLHPKAPCNSNKGNTTKHISTSSLHCTSISSAPNFQRLFGYQSLYVTFPAAPMSESHVCKCVGENFEVDDHEPSDRDPLWHKRDSKGAYTISNKHDRIKDEDEMENNGSENKSGEVEAELFEENKGSYPNISEFLEEAFQDDREIKDIIENSFEDPEEMGKRVNERIKRKEKDILQPKTGSPVPMKVSFCDFDPTDSYVWMELYSSPSEKDIDIIGSVIRSWYLLGCLGGYNSLNMQLTKIPVNERLKYKEYVEEDEFLPARFVNIGELEFQHNWGRFWVDLGTSDTLALDIFINAFIAISSDYVGVKEITFGGKDLGQWNEELMSEEEGYRTFRI